MMPMYWKLSGESELADFCEMVRGQWARGNVTWAEYGKEPESHRTLSQNDLFQVWARHYAKHLLKIKKVTPEQHEAMKYTLQRHCYAATGWEYLIGKNVDLFTGEEKPTRAHTSDFGVGEMHQFLDWVQARAADDGLILESLGEYRDLKEAAA